MRSMAEDLPPRTNHFEISCDFISHGWVNINLKTDTGLTRIEWVSDVGFTFNDLASSALDVATGRYKAVADYRSTEIRADHEPDVTVIEVSRGYLYPRTLEEEQYVLRVEIAHSHNGDIGAFCVSPDLFVSAVCAFLTGIRDGMGVDAYYEAYSEEEFPSKALAALEAAIQTPATPRPPPDMTGAITITIGGGAEPDESKTDD